MFRRNRVAPERVPPKEEDFDLRLDYWHEEVISVHIEMLKPYPEHPFKPLPPDKLEALAESIKQNGLQQPVILRDVDEDADYFIILSGHNRVEAMRMLGKDHVPAIIRTMDDDTAALTVVQTNLDQREGLLPSEKARAYKLQMDTLRKMGGTSTEGGHDVHPGKTRDILAQGEDTTGRTIQRYLRLNNLFDDYLNLMDDGTLSLAAGYELSFLDEAAQCEVWLYFYENNPAYRMPVKTAAALRSAFEAGQLVSVDSIPTILEHQQKKAKQLSLDSKRLKRYAIPDDVDVIELFYEMLEERFGRV